MDRLRVIQVGLGDWGVDWAWRIVPAVDEVESVAYVDSNPDAFAVLGRRLDVEPRRCFGSLSSAIAATRAEAVLVTTTLGGHEPLVRSALESGLHVLVEKPFTDNLASATALVELAAAAGRVLMVSQNYRFFPAPRAAARLVREKSLGDLYAIGIDFRRNAAAPPKARHRHHSDAQPLLVDMSIHHFDLLRMVLASEAISICCEAPPQPWGGFDGPPAAIASIAFDRALVSYRGSWVSSAPITPWAGEWSMEFEDGHVFWTSRGDKGVLKDRMVVRRRGGRAQIVPLPEMSRIDRAGTLTELAHAVRDGREPETSGRDNLGTIALTVAAVDSAKRHEWVDVPRAAERLPGLAPAPA